MSSDPPSFPVVACHDCDAAQIEPTVPGSLAPRTSVRCWRCGAVLARASRIGIEGGVALSAAALVLFLVAHSFPVAKVVLHGKPHEPTFIGSMAVVADQGHAMLASIVFITLVMIPLAQILASLYLLVPVWLGRVPRQVGLAFRLFHVLKPWSQLDILMLGIFVALGKMSRYADISVGVTLPALAGAIVLPILGSAALEGSVFWHQVALNRARRRGAPVRRPSGGAPSITSAGSD
jgi:paraquat-inducible protein A